MKDLLRISAVTGTLLVQGLAVANPAHDMVARMSDSERNSMFEKFMVRSAEPCGSVTRNFLQGIDKKGNATWNIACSNKKSFAITIYNDSQGSTKILSCAILKAVAQVECFKKF